ncbi:lysylphosphatidylglycerol synthase domain-containing protein [Brumimicrobium oceani]|uniref:Flippase-like domain-containing protein n=1 Tax=Brumimicrobium oceani TaxID=2100725 RepID=A0A2U2X0L7_9FLAO|nr:lysylphosphatidylglycerol synthase domain-containing protein [Brumimicrobium oceani]PWH81322.1 hypothetical protein DIT68_15415 [Brumimicrobium oceani]
MIKNIKVQKTLVWSLKLLLFIGVLLFFAFQIKSVEFSQFYALNFVHPISLVFVFVLLPVNWGLELLKWRRILQVNDIRFNLKKLLISLFSGIATGLITPNRIGNFIGRMVFFKGKVRGQIILGTLFSNYAQFVVTIFFGLLSFLFFDKLFFDRLGSSPLGFMIIFSSTVISFYFLLPYLPFQKVKFLRRRLNVIRQFQLKARQLNFSLLILSAIRYLIFSTQFALVLMAFGVTPSLLLYGGIFMVYLLSTLTPSLLFGKIIIRETVALFVLSFIIENEAVILVSSLVLWFINIGIPSLFGLFFILRRKLYGNS